MKQKIKRMILKIYVQIKYLEFLKYTSSCKKNKQFKYIIFNTPTHGNIGDHAIIIAEQKLFQNLKLKIYEVPTLISDFLLTKIKTKINNDDVICITGGGFIGSIWLQEENLVNEVLTNFKNNKIIIFPQTIYFDETEKGKIEFEKFKTNVNNCKNLTICLRENTSLNYVKDNIASKNVIFVPDVVLYLKNHYKFKEEKKGVLMCLRKDVEKSLSEDKQKKIEKFLKTKYLKIDYTDTVLNKNILPKNRESYLIKTLKEFSRYELVVTDRLHGMIFSILTNTPCIVLGNFNYKVKGVYECIKEKENVIFLEDVDNLEKYHEQIIKEKKLSNSYDYDRLIEKIIDK